MRTGIGYDIHRLIPTQEKMSIALGGVDLPCFYKVQAHSDGDVLLHALIDACLGALALGDIGQWFPDSDPANRGRKSSEFVKPVIDHLSKLNCKIEHVDSIVFLEEPKLAPHIEGIRRSIATLLGVELFSVSVKAKTMEGLGPIGHGNAIAAQVVVSVRDHDSNHK